MSDQTGYYGITKMAEIAASAAAMIPTQREISALGRSPGPHVMRQMCDMEALVTFEGTAEIQTLIVRRDITGQSAFA